MRRAFSVFAILGAALLAAPAAAQDAKTTFVFWEPDGLMYPAIVEQRQSDQAFVRYTDGTTEWVPPHRIGTYNVPVGQEVYGNWKNGGLYYRGRVTWRNGEQIRIQYDDGDVEDTTISLIRLRVQRSIASLPIGSPVFGNWGDGYWYPAKIQQAQNGQYELLYHDNQRQWLDADNIADWHVTVDDEVEADWRGRGGYYRAVVLSRNGTKVRVRYEDGVVEDTTISRLRCDLQRIARDR